MGVKLIEKSTCHTWTDFITQQGLESEALTEYYLKDARFPLSQDEELHLLNELLADMKAMGAFLFQSDINPEKVEVIVSSDYGADAFVLKERGRAGQVIIFSHSRARIPEISAETKMSSFNTNHLVQELGEARRKLDHAWFEHERMFGRPPRTHPEEWDGVPD